MNILVTGGAGYIGSHIAYQLKNNGYNVRILDDFSTGKKSRVENFGEIIVGSLLSKSDLSQALKNIDCVVHLAAKKSVEESVKNPIKYVENNLIGTINLVSAMLENSCRKIVFSSTAAVYSSKNGPLAENDETNPKSPYGFSKLWCEKTLKDFENLGLSSVSLRYFNVGGSMNDSLGDSLGDNLIPRIFNSVAANKTIKVFGSDYSTKDGTCLRDFVHVQDLASAHLKALEYMQDKQVVDIFNVGSGVGYTVKEVIEETQKLIQPKISYEFVQRRSGDVDYSLASISKIETVMGWKPVYSLKDILKSSWSAWQSEGGSR